LDAAVANLPRDHLTARGFKVGAVAPTVISVFAHSLLKLS